MPLYRVIHPLAFRKIWTLSRTLYHRGGLTINTKKTEILQSSSSSQQSFTVHGDTLNITQQFTYLGSILSSDSDLTNEIQLRIKLASSAFGRLTNRVFFNRNLKVSTKVAVYKAICLSVLLYGMDVRAGSHIDDTLRHWKPIISAACKVFCHSLVAQENSYRNT